MPDSPDERRRLSKLYAEMSETELREFAAGANSLTDIARTVLSTELERRGLKIESDEPSRPSREGEVRNLVAVRDFRGLPEAVVAKSILDAAGIECFLGNETMVRMDWFWSNLLGGVKVLVRKEDLETATQLLDRDIPEEFNVEGVGEYQQPRCPQCGSLDVAYKSIDAFGIPLSPADSYWKCEACGHAWPDADSKPPLPPPV